MIATSNSDFKLFEFTELIVLYRCSRLSIINCDTISVKLQNYLVQTAKHFDCEDFALTSVQKSFNVLDLRINFIHGELKIFTFDNFISMVAIIYLRLGNY